MVAQPLIDHALSEFEEQKIASEKVRSQPERDINVSLSGVNCIRDRNPLFFNTMLSTQRMINVLVFNRSQSVRGSISPVSFTVLFLYLAAVATIIPSHAERGNVKVKAENLPGLYTVLKWFVFILL